MAGKKDQTKKTTVVVIYCSKNFYLKTQLFKEVTAGMKPAGVCITLNFTAGIVFVRNCEFGKNPPKAKSHTKKNKDLNDEVTPKNFSPNFNFRQRHQNYPTGGNSRMSLVA